LSTSVLNAQIDAAKIIASARDAGNPAIPLVRELSDLVSSADPEAAKFVHAGATSQDVIDSAAMLQLKPALSKIESGIEQLQRRPGRTDWGTPGDRDDWPELYFSRLEPITFAFKLANWLDQLTPLRCLPARGARQSSPFLQFWRGQLARWQQVDRKRSPVLSRLAERLELAEAPIPWHTARDRFFRNLFRLCDVVRLSRQDRYRRPHS